MNIKEIKSKKDELNKILIVEDKGYKVVLRTDKDSKNIDTESIVNRHKKIVNANTKFIEKKLEQLKNK